MVKCADCGYLTMRNIADGGLDEMDSKFRETGEPPEHFDARVPVSFSPYGYQPLPLCFDLQFPLADELGEKFFDAPVPAVLEVIRKNRDCPAFTPWQQGFTPKEHREMLDREKMLQWQLDREEEDRRWRDEQRREDQRWRAEQRKHEGRWQLRQLIVFGGFVTCVSVVTQIVAAFIQR
jgi:hypothetical protein